MNAPPDIHHLISSLKAQGEPFAIATVVRTVSVTAAKAGAKAVIDKQGNITDGWIGGGCAKSAVMKAAREAIECGEPRLVSLLPQDLLKEVKEAEGVNIAANMCPSQGTMDIFVEPVLPAANLLVLGDSPVAIALEEIAARFGFSVDRLIIAESTVSTSAVEHTDFIVVSHAGQ